MFYRKRMNETLLFSFNIELYSICNEMLTPITLMIYKSPLSIPVINKLFMKRSPHCHLTL